MSWSGLESDFPLNLELCVGRLSECECELVCVCVRVRCKPEIERPSEEGFECQYLMEILKCPLCTLSDN